MKNVILATVVALSALTGTAQAADFTAPLPAFFTRGAPDPVGIHYGLSVSRAFESNTVGGLATSNGSFAIEGEASGTFTPRMGWLQGSQLGLVAELDTPSDSLGSSSASPYGSLAPTGGFGTGFGGGVRLRSARYLTGLGYSGFGGVNGFIDGGLLSNGFSGSFGGQSLDTRFTQAFFDVGAEAQLGRGFTAMVRYRVYSNPLESDAPNTIAKNNAVLAGLGYHW